MATPFLDLIRAVLPNFSDKQLRKIIPWFEAVSAGFDSPTTPQVVALANVDSAGTILKNYGFTGPALHPGTGQFALNLTETGYDINDLLPFANATNVGTPGGAINIYPAMNTGSQVFLNLWQITATTAARIAVDSEFLVMITKLP